MSEGENPTYDIAIIGGGPAGMSAALWADELGLTAILLERGPELGGQLLWTYNAVRNHLGVEAENGRELSEILERQLAARKFERRFSTEISRANLESRTIDFADGDSIRARAVVIATGVSRRRLGVPGEEEFRGRGIIDSGKRHGAEAKGKHVVIIGGGDAALENALILGEYAASVTIVHRRSDFTAREEFLTAARAHRNTAFMLDTVVGSINGGNSVTSVTVRSTADDTTWTIPAEIVLIRIGVEPNTELAEGQVGRDASGYIVVDSQCRTSIEGVYAVGDCANPMSATVSTAVGTGTTAVKSILSWLKG